MKNFLEGIGTGVDNFLSIFKRFNFREDDKKIKDSFEESANNLTKLNKDFVESTEQFRRDKDINSATKVAEDLGINEGGGGENISEDSFGDFSPENEKDVSEAVRTFSAEEVAVIEETGVIPEARAEGGDVVEGVPYVVGEQGPEIFVPKESGDIISNDEVVGAAEVVAVPEADGLSGVTDIAVSSPPVPSIFEASPPPASFISSLGIISPLSFGTNISGPCSPTT
jgi:hypothetical protein